MYEMKLKSCDRLAALQFCNARFSNCWRNGFDCRLNAVDQLRQITGGLLEFSLLGKHETCQGHGICVERRIAAAIMRWCRCHIFFTPAFCFSCVFAFYDSCCRRIRKITGFIRELYNWVRVLYELWTDTKTKTNSRPRNHNNRRIRAEHTKTLTCWGLVDSGADFLFRLRISSHTIDEKTTAESTEQRHN